jgi:hypothetical protein
MRRVLTAAAALAVVVILSSCMDRQQPLAPSSFPVQFSTATDGNSDVWILGRTWTLQNGTECSFYENSETDFGVKCGGTEVPWTGAAMNTRLFPVVEVCEIEGPGGPCKDEAKNSFVVRSGEIGVSHSSGKYRLSLKDQKWAHWNTQALGSGRYRVIVGITFTGLQPVYGDDPDNPGTEVLLGNIPVPGWNSASPKVLGWYEFQRDGSGNHNVQFRVKEGALCEGDGACNETALEPEDFDSGNLILLDTNEELQVENADGTNLALLGLQFPENFVEKLTEVLGQERVNIIVERITASGRCIGRDKFAGSGFSPGDEEMPCYSIRTEPYIDLAVLQISDPIKFGVCLREEAERYQPLLQMLKWSSVKNTVTKIGDTPLIPEPVDGLFGCPLKHPSFETALAPVEGTSRFAMATSRLLNSAKGLLLPQPAYAKMRRTTRSPASGSLMDFSRIVVQATGEFEAVFLSPIGSVNAAGDDNVGSLNMTGATVRICHQRSYIGEPCPPSPATGSTEATVQSARWDEALGIFQVNWQIPRNMTHGTYRIEIHVDQGLPLVKADAFNIEKGDDFLGANKYTHNAGRTLPIKFYLTAK